MRRSVRDPRHYAAASLKQRGRAQPPRLRAGDPRHYAGASLKLEKPRTAARHADRDPLHYAAASLKRSGRGSEATRSVSCRGSVGEKVQSGGGAVSIKANKGKHVPF